MGICIVICIGMTCMVNIYMVRSADVPGANFGCELCGAYTAAVGAIRQVRVAMCSVSAGVI